ncbi:MAG: NTP transferase domain-containing protein [Thermoplasmata archaeon]|nr:MAG: NTP transferase domain-containing protein [Thermoplasmata archaeon]
MKAVILTAGEGTRLRPLTLNMPKGMIPVANRPILEYMVEALASNFVKDIIMVVGYKKERVMSHFGDGSDFKINIEYVEQKKQLGTAHALKQAEPYIDSDFLVLPGDNIIDAKGIKKLLAARGKTDASMLVSRCDTPAKYGVVGLDGKNVTKIVEKPKITGDLLSAGVPSIFSLALWDRKEKTLSDIINTGILKFPKKIFKVINKVSEEQDKNDLTSVVQYVLSHKQKIHGVTTETWADAVYPWDLLNLNALALERVSQRKSGKVGRGVTISGAVKIGKDTVIHPNTTIMGPVIIGKGCEIGPNVVISPSTSIGENVTIAPFSELEHSIIMNDIQIQSFSHISNSIVSNGTRLGSHYVASASKSQVQVDRDLIEVKRIGTIIGEDCEIGHHVVSMPGCIIGTNCKIASLTEIRNNIPNNSNVI